MKKILMFLCVTAFSVTLFAQDTINEKRISRTVEKSKIHVVEADPQGPLGLTLKKIYSNLGPSTDAYNDIIGWTVSGPNSGIALTQAVAMPFTPASNSTVYKFKVAVGYITGAKQVNISLYNDISNAPGTLIVGPVTVYKLPTFGTCCGLAVANFSPGIPVTAGTQYWVVADTPTSGTGSDTWAAWNFINLPNFLFALNDNGSGWLSQTSAPNAPPAGAVYGTIP